MELSYSISPDNVQITVLLCQFVEENSVTLRDT